MWYYDGGAQFFRIGPREELSKKGEERTLFPSLYYTPSGKPDYFFGGAMVSFADFATRNFTTVFALILICSPV